MTLLEVTDLTVVFHRRGQADVHAVDGVTLRVQPGATVGIVGESGCGKSVTSLAVLGLLPRRRVDVAGSVRLEGEELMGGSAHALADVRGREIAMIFQDPMTSLNPVLTVGRQITEVLERHLALDRHAARQRAAELLTAVGIADADRRLRQYPHQLSGGMRQRVMIAIALACGPRIMIADEPTTALDVTIQAQILDLLQSLVRDTKAALVLITHDLGVVAGTCEVVYVMYAGRIVESATRTELFARPRHPYTAGLLASVPRLDQPRGEPLHPIPGSPSDTLPWSSACAFAPRCANRIAACTESSPALVADPVTGRELRCFNPVEPAP
jgi:peptide/nickel transport system ATP-binding protein